MQDVDFLCLQYSLVLAFLRWSRYVAKVALELVSILLHEPDS